MNQQLYCLENVGLSHIAFTSPCFWERAALQLVHASAHCPWMQTAMPQVTPGGITRDTPSLESWTSCGSQEQRAPSHPTPASETRMMRKNVLPCRTAVQIAALVNSDDVTDEDWFVLLPGLAYWCWQQHSPLQQQDLLCYCLNTFDFML